MLDIILSVIIYGVLLFVVGYGSYTLIKKIRYKKKNKGGNE